MFSVFFVCCEWLIQCSCARRRRMVPDQSEPIPQPAVQPKPPPPPRPIPKQFLMTPSPPRRQPITTPPGIHNGQYMGQMPAFPKLPTFVNMFGPPPPLFDYPRRASQTTQHQVDSTNITMFPSGTIQPKAASSSFTSSDDELPSIALANLPDYLPLSAPPNMPVSPQASDNGELLI